MRRAEKWERSNPDKVKAYNRESSRLWRERHPEKRRVSVRTSNLKRWGLSDDEILKANLAWERFDGTCDACGGDGDGRPFHTEHCHLTLKFRGIVCDSCNKAMGAVKDRIPRLRALVIFLERFA